MQGYHHLRPDRDSARRRTKSEQRLTLTTRCRHTGRFQSRAMQTKCKSVQVGSKRGGCGLILFVSTNIEHRCGRVVVHEPQKVSPAA